MVQTYRLVKQAKMIKTDDFSSVFNFRKRFSLKYLVMHYQPNTLQRARLGLVVGKKTAKLAVSRNYMRRVLREFFRLNQHDICHVDLIIRVQKKFDKVDFIQIKQEFDSLIYKLNQRVILSQHKELTSNDTSK
ncbi:ribonuclease P protein component [Methylotenera versatilis]|jgi:ribonuclease P protein component|uniref:Ribonuclease P protein component n=1 Tax=Methylotenera versatilis (strain 301) TaxID=666681 RepID=D7DPN9_METV0|nr:ribonuclease P protein component [Methylotenera versatilis]ADI31152.1 ribonuclease P protein component [Methylotenera versatilis 301]